MLFKLFKFCLVGGSGMVLDFAITYLLKELIKIHRYAANAFGFMCAASSNFALNRYWTFDNHHPEIYKQYVYFLCFSIVGLGINTLFLFLFEKKIHRFYIAKFFSILVTTFWNFTTNYFFTFHE